MYFSQEARSATCNSFYFGWPLKRGQQPLAALLTSRITFHRPFEGRQAEFEQPSPLDP